MSDMMLRLDLNTPDEFCSICQKLPARRLVLDLLSEEGMVRVSVCRDCLAEYAPETLAAIEQEAGRNG